MTVVLVDLVAAPGRPLVELKMVVLLQQVKATMEETVSGVSMQRAVVVVAPAPQDKTLLLVKAETVVAVRVRQSPEPQ
jgi:hypothetical protein